MEAHLYTPAIYQADRQLHHELALESYRQSFNLRKLTDRHQDTTFRRLADVFSRIQIADPDYPTILRPIDTFDLINPLQSSRILEACKRDLPNESRVKACFSAIKYYCKFLQACPVIHLPGQRALILSDLYGPITCPITRYSILPDTQTEPHNYAYLTRPEYREWLKFTATRAEASKGTSCFYKDCQLHLMSVLAGQTGMRLQELIGLDREHVNFADGRILITKGKRKGGGDYRKREVPLSKLAEITLKNFLAIFPRNPKDPLLQSQSGQRLSKNTASGWMQELVQEVKKAELPIYLDRGFGWHGFRRTFARLFVEDGGTVEELKLICAWAYTSTLAHYMGDPKPSLPTKGLPLDWDAD
jgi:integrase